MSLSDVDRLAAALLTLLRSTDNDTTADNSEEMLTGDASSLSVERKIGQHLPLSAALSLPSSVTRSPCTSRCQWRRSSCSLDTTSALDRRRQQDDRGHHPSPRYKTELCRGYAEHGTCRYGDKCQFAHGRDDLRTVARHPKYKTDLCRTYHTTGLCPYGPRCHFIHNDDDARRRPPPSTAEQQPDSDLASPELELRLALLSLCQRQKLVFQSSAATSSFVDAKSDQTAGVTPRAVRPWHIPLDRRRQSVPVTVFHPSTPPASALIGVSSPPVAGSLDSVGNSSSSSAAGDDSPPPALSPTLINAPDACRQLLDLTPSSNDRLAALLTLAARLRLMQDTSATH